jgi:hypothetical protein
MNSLAPSQIVHVSERFQCLSNHRTCQSILVRFLIGIEQVQCRLKLSPIVQCLHLICQIKF